MRLTKRLHRAVLRNVLPPPVDSRHAEYSMIFSSDDDISRPSPRLMRLALDAVVATQSIQLTTVCDDAGKPIEWVNQWPGEHYRLLAGLVAVLKPKVVIEIGTGSGGSALAMKQTLPADGKIVTFDLIDWPQLPEGVIRKAHFADGRLEHRIDDVSQTDVLSRYRELFESADFFFIDAAKDGVMEQRLLDALRSTLRFRASPVMAFDDIRLWNMLKIWRQVSFPKLDLTSFGHWTGTGLVEWPSR